MKPIRNREKRIDENANGMRLRGRVEGALYLLALFVGHAAVELHDASVGVVGAVYGGVEK